MGADQNIAWTATIASALDWWREAGVEALIDETPRDWRAAIERASAATRALDVAEAAPRAAAPAQLPATIDEFLAWRVGPEAPEAAWRGTPIAAQGSPGADLLILLDQPEREDAETGVLMSGAAGRLFDRMLAAIGRNRESIYLVPLCTVRPLAGRIDPGVEERLGEIARHHVALAAPKRVLLLGNAPSRALLAAEMVHTRGGLRRVNPVAGIEDRTIEAVATFHPRLLLERPGAKAEAWKDLQMLIGGLT